MLRRFLIVLPAFIVLVPAAAVGAGMIIRLPGGRRTPSGLVRNQGVYVTRRDGTRITVDL